MRDTGLADRLRRRGIQVVEIAGWKTRGSDFFNPKGSVNHHTAGSAFGVAPSLGICTYGRADLPGPLCQVLLGRNLVAYVIAAGRANHAGRGGWNGLIGNSSVYGLEIEHIGSGPSQRQLDVAVQIHAAFLEGPTMPGDAGLVCQHFEWAPGRKIDFRDLAPYNVHTFRQAIARALSRPAEPDPEPEEPVQEVYDKMLYLIQGDKSPAWWLTDELHKIHVPTARFAAERIWTAAVTGGRISTAKNNQPHKRKQSEVDRIPIVGSDDPRDHAIELRAIDIRGAIEELTEAVLAFAQDE